MYEMKPVRRLISVDQIPLPDPVGYFRRGEFAFKLSGLRWDGDMRLRGDKKHGIPPEVRRETDCRDQDGVLTLLSDFYPSEYSREALRLRTVLVLSKEASRGLLDPFRAYQERWNILVAQDRSGVLIRAQRGDRTARDYVNRRRDHPLRLRSWRRTTSIPVTHEIKAELKKHLDLDWRKVTKPRLLRLGKEVALSYVMREIRVHEVNLEARTINSCRDPRLIDIGICLDHNGMTVEQQNPTDDHQGFIIPMAQLTKQKVQNFVADLVGKVRVVALDPYVPTELADLKTYLTRKCRALHAEGAIEFRSPKLVSLGAVYRDLPSYHPQHLKVRERNSMREYFDYTRIWGLTGEPLMVREAEGGLVGVDGRQIHPLTRANHILQSVMATLDLWHGATFLRSVGSPRVRRVFRAFRCEQEKRGNSKRH